MLTIDFLEAKVAALFAMRDDELGERCETARPLRTVIDTGSHAEAE